jgi:hypothetical protein
VNTRPDFFLASAEGFGLESLRHVHALRRLRGERRGDYLLARIEPPIIGQPYGLGSDDIREVVLAARHVGESIFAGGGWPIDVHVARLLRPSEELGETLEEAHMSEIAWAELHADEETALLAIRARASDG